MEKKERILKIFSKTMQNKGGDVASRLIKIRLIFYAGGSRGYNAELYKQIETVAEAALTQG